MDAPLAREIAALYEVPSSEFTARRNARAKSLKQDDPELAAAVAGLAKPTAAAAAVNRLARDDPSEVRALIQTGKRLREAQEQAVSGAVGPRLQEAMAEHRQALERVRREARKLNVSDQVLDRVTATLRAASIDAELQPLLERGLLAHELEGAGFGLDVSVARPSTRPAKPTTRPAKKTGAAKRPRPRPDPRLEEARARLTLARQEQASAERNVKRVERELSSAAAALQRAKAELARAEERLARIRKG